ncbi:hypothetical protein Ancab_003279 [Ancistrocladus abbreviatus]
MAIATIMNLNDETNSSNNNNNNSNSNSVDNYNNKQQQQHRLQHEQDDQHDHDMVMPGFRFHPTEEELVEFYLRRKVEGKKFNVELITFLDLYRYDPWELPALAAIGEKEWFFYVPRDRKYRNGDRPNRVTTSGYWKATGADRMIRAENFRAIGLKKTLVFYTGKAPKGIRTSWIMNEYRLPQHETERYQKVEMSLCRVYKRAGMEDHPSMPRGLPSKQTSRGTVSLSSSSLLSEKKQNQQHCFGVGVGTGGVDQMDNMSTTYETDASSSTEVGTALGLAHHDNSNTNHNNNSSSLLAPMEMEKIMLFTDNSSSLKREAAGASTTTSPLLGNCTTLFMGSSSGPPSNPALIDDLHRLVTYQQACMITQQPPPPPPQPHFHGVLTYSSVNPSAPFYSSLLSQSHSTSLGLNAATAPGGSSTVQFSDRLWEWNSIPDPSRDFNSPFK